MLLLGDIVDVQLPTNATGRPHENRESITATVIDTSLIDVAADLKHRGYAFVTFSSAGDAQDAIDNMDMNELRGRVLKVNIARPMKGVTPSTGNRASESSWLAYGIVLSGPLVWESEDWLKQYAKPLSSDGGEERTP
jgi:peptidyl-prolyl isomerase E (cyclophilin E)